MPRNIEFKVPFEVTVSRRVALNRLHIRESAVLEQTDTYFHCHHGRLKLREVTEQANGRSSQWAELIAYHRPNDAGLRDSDYVISSVPDAAALKAALAMTLGERVVVRKRRELLIWENVRIHLDEVEKLGSFLEFEAVLERDDDAAANAESHRRLETLMFLLKIDPGQAIAGSYADMIASG